MASCSSPAKRFFLLLIRFDVKFLFVWRIFFIVANRFLEQSNVWLREKRDKISLVNELAQSQSWTCLVIENSSIELLRTWPRNEEKSIHICHENFYFRSRYNERYNAQDWSEIYFFVSNKNSKRFRAYACDNLFSFVLLWQI
jgi:hypothetical protein